jgi:hypothetical protein
VAALASRKTHDLLTLLLVFVRMAKGRIQVGQSNYSSVSKEAMDRNLYSYLWVEIHTRIHTRRVYHSTYKNHIKIISLMSKAQYKHVQN